MRKLHKISNNIHLLENEVYIADNIINQTNMVRLTREEVLYDAGKYTRGKDGFFKAYSSFGDKTRRCH